MRHIITRKIPVSIEEKRQRAEEYNLYGDGYVNVEEFIKKDIYDEYVDLICAKCGHKDEIEYDIFLELFEFIKCDIPELECPFCRGGTAIPIQFIGEYKKKNKKK